MGRTVPAMDSFEQFVQQRMSRTKLASVTVAVVARGDIIYQRGFGLRDVDAGLPATPATLYGIGSVTKSFTCLALMQLQEQGLLSVEDPVEKYLPLTVRPFGEPIRIRHFMSHSSGIPALAYAEALLRHKHGASDRYLPMGGTDDILTFVNGAADWVQSRPGERWFYLNEGYALLGAIIEKVSGLPYVDYVEQRILAPLDMSRSFFRREQVKANADVAVPYAMDDQGRHKGSDYTYGQIQADGGLISSVLDMCRYIGLYLEGGKGLVSRDSLNAMTRGEVPVPIEDPSTGEPVSRYGFGLRMQQFFGRTLVGHGGSVLAATASMQFLPEDGLGVMVLANGSGYPLDQIAQFALAAALGEDPWRLPALRLERLLESLTGDYETYQSTYGLSIVRDGDFLSARIKNKYGTISTPLVPLDQDPAHPRFFTLGGGRRQTIEFFVKEGQVELLFERYKLRRVRTG